MIRRSLRAARATLVDLLIICLLLPAVAHAGDCAPLVRPLLLQPAPDAAQLEAVKAVCERAARAGDPRATYQLSFFYLGLGGRWQPALAIPLIREAAEQGVAEAQYWLAWQSEAGPALPHNEAVAVSWYQRAADSDHRLALQRLADAYERGEMGLRVDPGRALALRARLRRCDQ